MRNEVSESAVVSHYVWSSTCQQILHRLIGDAPESGTEMCAVKAAGTHLRQEDLLCWGSWTFCCFLASTMCQLKTFHFLQGFSSPQNLAVLLLLMQALIYVKYELCFTSRFRASCRSWSMQPKPSGRCWSSQRMWKTKRGASQSMGWWTMWEFINICPWYSSWHMGIFLNLFWAVLDYGRGCFWIFPRSQGHPTVAGLGDHDRQ